MLPAETVRLGAMDGMPPEQPPLRVSEAIEVPSAAEFVSFTQSEETSLRGPGEKLRRCCWAARMYR
ncbi:hypothetical protein C0Z17_00975 [Trinickia caryophylli]|nr:hypothetical protein C0Z17_00975 [Trinickia caryophylli]